MSLGMDPGMLREEVTILEDVGSATDALGGSEAADFQPIASDAEEYARIKPMSADARLNAKRQGAPAEYEVTFRFREDVDTRNRLRWDSNGSRVLILVGGPIDKWEHQEYLTFRATEDRD